MSTRRLWAWTAVLGLLVAAGCTGERADGGSPNPGRAPGASPTPTPTPTQSPSGAPTRQPDADETGRTEREAPPHPVSLPTLMDREYDGRALRTGRVLDRTEAYTSYFVTYRSGGLRISGIMNVPQGDGPFPVLVLGHGYIDPAVYTNGQGLTRERDYFARAGYVVLHTDYRGHAQSDAAPANERRLRLGYTVDVINAVLAVRRSSLPYLDGDRVGLMGRSMGGGIVYNVLTVRPRLVDAAAVHAPVSSDTVDNFNRWIRGERADLTEAIVTEYGAPRANPRFWRNVSPVTFFDRMTEPLLVLHGTTDDTCPLRWSRETVGELRRLGKDVRLRTYAGEGHTFYAAWERSMRHTTSFFDRHLARPAE